MAAATATTPDSHAQSVPTTASTSVSTTATPVPTDKPSAHVDGTWWSACNRATPAATSAGSAPLGVTAISAPAARTVSWLAGVRVAVYISRLVTAASEAPTQDTRVALTAAEVEDSSRARRTSDTTVTGSSAGRRRGRLSGLAGPLDPRPKLSGPLQQRSLRRHPAPDQVGGHRAQLGGGAQLRHRGRCVGSLPGKLTERGVGIATDRLDGLGPWHRRIGRSHQLSQPGDPVRR